MFSHDVFDELQGALRRGGDGSDAGCILYKIRLRDFDDIGRWLQGSFSEKAEWREIPHEIVLGPGLVVPVGPGSTGKRERKR